MQGADSRGLVVITGAASGIGLALLEEALARGFDVAAADISEEALGNLEGLAEPARLLRMQADVSDPAAATAFAKATLSKFGRVDYVFNNAGIFASGRIIDVTAAAWQKIMNVNVLGVVNIIHAFVPAMMEQQQTSRMILTSSLSSFVTTRSVGPYSASKYAVLAIAQTLDQELRKDANHVKVSLLVPGAVRTGLLANSNMENSAAVVGALEEAMTNRGDKPGDVAVKVFDMVDSAGFLIALDEEALRHSAATGFEKLFASSTG